MFWVESLICLEEHLLQWVLHVREMGWKMRPVVCVKLEAMRRSNLSRENAQALDFSTWQEAADLAMQA